LTWQPTRASGWCSFSTQAYVCPTELADLAKAYGKLQKLGAEVLAVSADSVNALKMWDDQELSKMVKGGIPFPMLADAGAAIAKKYGVFDEGGGQNHRAYFIIDPAGVVRSMAVLPAEMGRDIKEILRQVEGLEFVAKNAVMLPSGWQPGDNGITPKIDLAGKVWESWKPPKTT
jgi:alkyl hydroperoxide reductase subunit AhpC